MYYKLYAKAMIFLYGNPPPYNLSKIVAKARGFH